MRRAPWILALALLSPCASAQLPSSRNAGVNQLSPLERDAGWELLFDGETTAGWRSVSGPEFPGEGWEVSDGTLHHTRGGGDLVTENAYADFELEFEWKVAPGANSGVKYMVPQGNAGSAYGPEYQVLDNDAHRDAGNPEHSAAALYDLMPASGVQLRPVGEFNRGRIVSRKGRLEHWLNGVRVMEVNTRDKTWSVIHAASKYAGSPDFARSGFGLIALQDHGDEVWFRDLRIRRLPAAGFEEVELLPGDGLQGWSEYGDARYVREDRTILGEVDGGGQSFLLSKQAFGDFIFEVDVKTELPGNSGIQIRCHQRENGRPYGYQIEIDPSPRSWSGGLYDEARRGWLHNLEHNDAGRAAFVYGEWNRFRIECVGPWIRASVNGIPTADYVDLADVEGVLGLQVHSGNNTRVRWRAPRIWNLGRRTWKPGAFLQHSSANADPLRSSGSLSLSVSGGEPIRVDIEGPASPDEVLVARFFLTTAARTRLNIGDASFSLNSSELFTTDKANEVGFCRDGDRTFVLLNGRPLTNAEALDERAGGASIFLEGEGADCLLEDLETLSPRR